MEFNIVTLFERYSGEIALCSVAANIVSLCLSKLFKASAKWYACFSFLLGAVIYTAVGLFVIKEDLVTLAANAITSGLLSGVLCAFIKRFAFLSGDDIKKSIEKLLSSIVLSEQLDEVVEGIVEKLKNDATVTKDTICDIVRENVSGDCNEEELDKVCSFIFEALGGAPLVPEQEKDKTE